MVGNGVPAIGSAYVELQVDVDVTHEALDGQVVVGGLVLRVGEPVSRGEYVEVAVVVDLHLAVVLEALLEHRGIDPGGSGPHVERGRVGNRRPRTVLEQAEFHRRVLGSVVLHVLARCIEVPILAVDPVLPSPEVRNVEVVVGVCVARPHCHIDMPLDGGAVSGEVEALRLAVVVVGGPVPDDPVFRAGRQVAGIPHHLVATRIEEARVMGPVPIDLGQQGDWVPIGACAVLEPEAIAPVVDLVPVLPLG